MTTKRVKKYSLLAFLLFTLANFFANFAPGHDFYPFYSWNLYSKVPYIDQGYFVGVDDDEAPILLYGDKVSEYLNINQLPEYYDRIQIYGSEFENGKHDGLENYLGPALKVGYEYQVYKVRFKAYDLLKSGEIVDRQFIGHLNINK